MEEGVKNLFNSLLKAIDAEREEEKNIHIEEIRSLKGSEREEKGRCLVGIKKVSSTLTLSGDYLYTFAKKDKNELPELEFSVGDQVIISLYDPLDASNPTGVIYEIGKKYIVVQSSAQLPNAGTRPFRLDLFVNDLTYLRMTNAILQAKGNSIPQAGFIRTILSGAYNASTRRSDIDFPNLNEKQKDAVEYAISCNGFYLIQGPPGTGKTHASASMIRQLVNQKKKILIACDSNAGVDNLIKKLIGLELDPVRIGNPIRVNAELKEYTLDYRISKHILFGEIAKIEAGIDEEKRRQKEMEKPAVKDMKGLKYSEIMELLDKNITARGISRRTLRSMKPYAKSQVRVEKLREEIKQLRDEMTSSILNEAEIICATCSASANEILDPINFDFCIIDEASQASIPSSLIPILRANRFILVGDHYQLSPVVISREAEELGLGISLMDKLASLYPYQMTMLEVQYRMNKKICELVSSMFYRSKLIPDDSVANRRIRLKNPSLTYNLPLTSAKYKTNSEPLELIHIEGREYRMSETGSLYNPIEAAVLQNLITLYLSVGIREADISVITPYRAQVDYLRARIRGIEIDTVDAFQGRENDFIIISMVRSNSNKEMGFLNDRRRLNVSFSRARKKLIILRDKNTVDLGFSLKKQNDRE